ncbi:MAG: UDP-N-acetylmuramoyl-L-alanine--D-glutamate ligase [Ignavibacteriaceae bacterium]
MEINNKNITVIGAVKSGVGAAKLIKKFGGFPFVSDINDNEMVRNSVKILEELGIPHETGEHSEKVYNCDLMVVSPGVPSDAPVIKEALSKGIRIISELELASAFCKGKIVAVTGTNGKTTTTSFCGHLFNYCGRKTYTAGNIGLAFSEIAPDVNENELVALEVSSFQLDLIERFKPKIAVILNITPDHLDRYEGDFSKYVHSKFRIFENQDKSDFLVLNRDSEVILNSLPETKSVKYLFSTLTKVENGCCLEDGMINFYREGEIESGFDPSLLKIKGEHNLSNAMAVITTAKILELDDQKITEALKSFEGVEHRLEPVREIDGIVFINDSKATNVDSVWYALRSFNAPIFLILGGQDKGNDYNRIKDLVAEKVKKIYAIGSSAEKIFNFFHSVVKVELKASLDDTVHAAMSEARSGDIVLFSPACASFDMFDNYEHRGKVFKEAVMSL